MNNEVLLSLVQNLMHGAPVAVRITVIPVDKLIKFNESGPTRQVRETEIQIGRQLQEEVRQDLDSQGVPPSETHTSTSHSFFGDTLCIVVIGSHQKMGVDVEHHLRKVHPGVIPRIQKPEEKRFEFSVLETWVIKEAAFKAYAHNQGTTLPGYRILSWDAVQKEGVVQYPSLGILESGRFCLSRLGAWWIAIATSDTFKKQEP